MIVVTGPAPNHVAATRGAPLFKYLLSLLGRLYNYVLVAGLLLTEGLIRSIGAVDTRSFLGPTLATAGISILAPAAVYAKKPGIPDDIFSRLPKSTAKILEAYRTRWPSGPAVLYTIWCMTLMLILFFIWLVALYMSIESIRPGQTGLNPTGQFLWFTDWPKNAYFGLASASISFFFAEFSEALK